MLGIDTSIVSGLLEEARKSTGKTLPTKGHYFDQGMRPTHKEMIVDLYEQGHDELAIAQRTDHAQSSVGRYLQDYTSIKLLYQRNISAEEIVHILGLQPNVVSTYISFVEKYQQAT
jgi:hypothetical protein